jgi:hypothetical protein
MQAAAAGFDFPLVHFVDLDPAIASVKDVLIIIVLLAYTFSAVCTKQFPAELMF